MADHRASFDAEIAFSNGGDLAVHGFRAHSHTSTTPPTVNAPTRNGDCRASAAARAVIVDRYEHRDAPNDPPSLACQVGLASKGSRDCLTQDWRPGSPQSRYHSVLL